MPLDAIYITNSIRARRGRLVLRLQEQEVRARFRFRHRVQEMHGMAPNAPHIEVDFQAHLEGCDRRVHKRYVQPEHMVRDNFPAGQCGRRG